MFSHMLTAWAKFSVQICRPSQAVSEITSLSRCPVLLGMGCILPYPLWEGVLLLLFPLGMEWIVSPLTTTSHIVIWAESSSNTQWLGFRKFVMVVQTIWCWPVSHLGNVVCLVALFLEKNQFLYDFLSQLADGWHMLADVADSHADYQWFEAAYDGTGDWRVLSTCHRPHIGHQICFVMSLPLLFRGVVHALSLQWWTEDSTQSALMLNGSNVYSLSKHCQ